MSNHFAIVEYNRHNYPGVELTSGCLKRHTGYFLIDHSLLINLIKESELSSFVYINTNNQYTGRQNTICTRGSVNLEFEEFSLTFGAINHDSDSEISGILGAPFLDQLFKTEYFNRIAENHERVLEHRSSSIRERVIRRVCRFFRARPIRNLLKIYRFR